MKFQDCIEKIEDLGSKKEIMTNMHKIRNGMIDLPEASQDNVNDDDDPRAPSPIDDPFDQLVSVVPPPTQQATLTDEQRARMMRNRLLAEERRQARRLAREKEMEAQRQSTGNPDPIDLDEADHADRQTSELDTPSTEMDRERLESRSLRSRSVEISDSSAYHSSVRGDQLRRLHFHHHGILFRRRAFRLHRNRTPTSGTSSPGKFLHSVERKFSRMKNILTPRRKAGADSPAVLHVKNRLSPVGEAWKSGKLGCFKNAGRGRKKWASCGGMRSALAPLTPTISSRIVPFHGSFSPLSIAPPSPIGRSHQPIRG
ncbi:unnamed protein product [Nesidiocoris tenuis]|uniref:TIMELESS-interacting protein n=1 Tax=Nesidiocoris tenuis TaxID=355587 RepID=A0A6H5HPP4_9HEMI|nr:unnamed protein product [Nesidiocoris tenuis]